MAVSWRVLVGTALGRCLALAGLLLGADRAAVKPGDRPPTDPKACSENPYGGLGNLDFARARQRKLARKRPLSISRASGGDVGRAGSSECARAGGCRAVKGRRVPFGSGRGKVKAVSVDARGEIDGLTQTWCSQVAPLPTVERCDLALECGNAGSPRAVGRGAQARATARRSPNRGPRLHRSGMRRRFCRHRCMSVCPPDRCARAIMHGFARAA